MFLSALHRLLTQKCNNILMSISLDNEVTRVNRIKLFEEELQQLKEKHKLDPIATIEFPQYRDLPNEVLLALSILETHKYKIMLSYKEI